ncbi:transporter [Flavobacterium flavigenum]|uniref:transporter n=1 Tax=Flavobacterium flavigenum TaxID=3003258 RepID=UPI0022AC24F7|nr:transporter [Flavobacterium flavigenum]
MLKIKNFLIACLFLLFPQYFFAQYTDVINSNRPGETMSAFSVGKSVIQAEAGFYGIYEKHDTQNYEASGFGTDFTLRWGLFLEELEFIADIQYQNEKFTTPATRFKKSNLRQTYLGAKYLIYDPYKNYKEDINIYSYSNKKFRWRQLIPAVSIFAGANIVLKNNPYAYNSNILNYYSTESGVSPKLMLATQHHFGAKWVLVSNLIADYIGTDNSGYGYIITLTRGFNKKWSGFVENQGYKSDLYSDAIFRGGAAYLLSRNVQIDASVSKNLKNTPSLLYGGIGFSIRYDDMHKEELTRVGKIKKPKNKNKKDKMSKEELEAQDKTDPKEDYQEKERKRKAKYEKKP